MIKRLFLGISGLLCLAVLGGAWFISTLDLNRYRQDIQQLVMERTGRALSIDGEIEAVFFPWIGLQLHDVTLANAEGFASTDFASVRASDVQLELLPLISGTFNVKWVKLIGLRLNLNINEDGVANWEDLVNTTTVVETETGEDDVLQAVEAGAPLAAALSVGGIEVSDAQINWVDESASMDVAVEKLDLTTDAIQLGRPFEFSTSFDVSSQALQAASSIVASGVFTIDVAGHSYTLGNLALQTTSNAQGLPMDTLDAALSGDVVVNLKAQTVDFTQLKATVENVSFSGELHGTGLLETPSVFGEFTSESFNAANLLRELGNELPSAVDAGVFANTKFDLSFQQTEDQILLNGVRLSSAGTELSGDFQVSNLAQSPVISGKLSSNVFNPAPWMTLVDWTPADPLVMQQARLAMALRQSGQILSLQDLQLVLDDFTLAGHVEVTDINAASPPLVFELHGTRLEVERYLPVAEILEDTTVATELSTQTLPVEQLRALDINGVITFDALSYGGVTLTDIAVPLVAADGNIEIAEAKAALYGGTSFNSASIDLNTAQPLLKWSSNVSAVQSEALLGDYLKSDSPISGTGILNIDMLTRGVSQAQWLEEADGAISLRFTDGAIKGINIGREIRRTRALLQGQSFADTEPNATDFTELSISGEINDGILRSDDLSLKAPLLRMTGDGALDLLSQQVNYVASVLVTADAEGQDGDEMSELNGLTLSLPISGPLSDLSVDFGSLLSDALQIDFSRQWEKQLGVLQTKQKEVEAAVEASQQRVEQVLEDTKASAEVLLEENKEVVIEQVEARQEQIQQQAEQAVEEQIDDIKQSIGKGISDLLDK